MFKTLIEEKIENRRENYLARRVFHVFASDLTDFHIMRIFHEANDDFSIAISVMKYPHDVKSTKSNMDTCRIQ